MDVEQQKWSRCMTESTGGSQDVHSDVVKTYPRKTNTFGCRLQGDEVTGVKKQ